MSDDQLLYVFFFFSDFLHFSGAYRPRATQQRLQSIYRAPNKKGGNIYATREFNFRIIPGN